MLSATIQGVLYYTRNQPVRPNASVLLQIFFFWTILGIIIFIRLTDQASSNEHIKSPLRIMFESHKVQFLLGNEEHPECTFSIVSLQ